MSVGNGRVTTSEPPESGEKTDRELLDQIYADLKTVKREFAQHRTETLAQFADMREGQTQTDARIEMIRGQQERLNRTVSEATREAKEARIQANRVETAHDADIAARQGHATAVASRLVNDAIDAKGDKRRLMIQIIVSVLALLGAAAGGAASSQSLFGG